MAYKRGMLIAEAKEMYEMKLKSLKTIFATLHMCIRWYYTYLYFSNFHVTFLLECERFDSMWLIMNYVVRKGVNWIGNQNIIIAQWDYYFTQHLMLHCLHLDIIKSTICIECLCVQHNIIHFSLYIYCMIR